GCARSSAIATAATSQQSRALVTAWRGGPGPPARRRREGTLALVRLQSVACRARAQLGFRAPGREALHAWRGVRQRPESRRGLEAQADRRAVHSAGRERDRPVRG